MVPALHLRSLVLLVVVALHLGSRFIHAGTLLGVICRELPNDVTFSPLGFFRLLLFPRILYVATSPNISCIPATGAQASGLGPGAAPGTSESLGYPFLCPQKAWLRGGGVKEDPGLRPGAYSAIWADLPPEATN